MNEDYSIYGAPAFSVQERPYVDERPASAEPYLNALVSEQGNVYAAAESVKLTVPEFVAVIARDPQAQPKLEQRLRILATLNLFSTISLVSGRVRETLGELEGKDAARAYTNMIEIIERITRNVTAPEGTTFDKALEGMPKHVQEAFLQLVSIPPPTEVIQQPTRFDSDDDL